MNTRLGLNLALAGTIIVLALLVILEPGKEKPAESPKLTTLSADSISRITVERAGRDTLVFEKRGSDWHITQPLSLRANDFKVTSLARAAQAASYARFAQAGHDLKQFDLDAPKLKLTLNGQVIEFGSVNPLDNRRYVRVADTVHLIGDEVYARLNGEAAGFVSSALLTDHVQELREIKLLDRTFTRDTTSGKWTVTPPVPDFSADELNTYLDEWRHAQALQVSAYSGTPGGTSVTLTAGSDAPLVFDVRTTDNELILGRKEAGVEYHFTPELRQRLLEPKHVAESPKPGSPEPTK